ncbi:MAG: HEAT repeat domain-containing protein [Paenibacillus sp.]|uniref:HEAT repeat domain-containing protein n=1 Tax=Paenibacillus sp. TaxID=58172 RepID=UPI0025FE4C36|nr:HEAT repeat domain-containing protein [Paenibacillus sp.]MBR2566016.1 HEAT repeat domain-containing protein [Paenibacillus sp.]
MKNNHTPLDKHQVLHELDSLGYSNRMKKIARLGRDHLAMASKEYTALLIELLDSGTAYEAHLALTGAGAIQDAQAVMHALEHPKAGVRGRAAWMLAEAVHDPGYAIESEIISMSYHGRHLLLRSIVKNNRQDWAERLLPLVLERWGAKEAVLLLSICGEETVRVRLPQLGYAIRNWRTLTTRHPDLVAAYLQDSLQKAPDSGRSNVWWMMDTAVEKLCTFRPAIVLDYALTYGPKELIHPVIKLHLGTLIKSSPERVFELLTRRESREYLLNNGVPAGVLKKRRYFKAVHWTALVTMLAESPLQVAKVLDVLAPSSREALFNAAYPVDERKNRIFPMALLDVLPHQLRDKEAARMLTLREVREGRDRTLALTARRLIAEARGTLEKSAQVTNADERAVAYAHLIQSTALSRRGMEETLRFLTRVKNDQDPVRFTVMSELTNCPVPMFQEEHVEHLTILVDSVIEARDTSYGTRTATEKLAFAILREHAHEPQHPLFQFALRTMKRMAMRDGRFMLYAKDWDSLPQAALETLFDELYAMGIEANKRESDYVVLRMADAFGKAMDRLPKLHQLLSELVNSKNSAAQAVRYWLAPYKTRDERVRKLLDRDPTFISFHEVFAHLHLKRQEWLDPFISGKVLKGKHLSGKTIYLVPAYDGFYRWLPRQQHALATMLERIAQDSERSFHERAHAMRSLAGMPDYDAKPLLEKLLLDPEVHIVEAALHAFSLTEEPDEALPVLLNNLDGDRARVSMYSIPKCARRVSPVLLTSVLSELLDREKLKITVRKEAVRLLGAYKSSESMTLLVREYEKPNRHKDVIIAIGHAARQCLDDERSWAMMSVMATSTERDIARSLLNQSPYELPVEARLRYLQWITEIASHDDPVVSTEAFRAMIHWKNVSAEVIADCAGQALVNLQEGSRWRAALSALVSVCQDGKVNDQVVHAIRELAEADIPDNWNAGSERDLPHRQRLLEFIDQLIACSPPVRTLLAPLYAAIIETLQPHDTLKLVVIRLRLAAIDWSQPSKAADGLHHIIDFVNATPYVLESVNRQVRDAALAYKAYWKAEDLLAIIDILSIRTDMASSCFGLSLLKLAGEALFWNQDCRERLRSYRQHEHEAVRLLALNRFTTLE